MISTNYRARKIRIFVREGIQKSIELNAPIPEPPSHSRRFEKAFFAVITQRELGSGRAVDIETEITDRLMLR